LALLYPRLTAAYLYSDREADHSVLHQTVQLFTVPSIASNLLIHTSIFRVILACIIAWLKTDSETLRFHRGRPEFIKRVKEMSDKFDQDKNNSSGISSSISGRSNQNEVLACDSEAVKSRK